MQLNNIISSHLVEHPLTIVAGDLNAGGGREEAVAALATAHAGRLEDGGGVVVMKWIVAGPVGAVIRNALEAVYAVACRSESESAGICEKCPGLTVVDEQQQEQQHQAAADFH